MHGLWVTTGRAESPGLPPADDARRWPVSMIGCGPRGKESGNPIAVVPLTCYFALMDRDAEESAFTQLGQRGLVRRMHEQLDELLAARDQMEQLLQVIVEIGAGLDLDSTLHRIIVAARELTHARAH